MLTLEQDKQLEQLCDDNAPYVILNVLKEVYGSDRKRDLIDEMIEYLRYEGYLTIKPSSILEEQRIEEFIEELRPHCNERQYLFL